MQLRHSAPWTFQADRGSNRIDALFWFGISAVLLALLPIGLVSGDGIAHSARYAAGTWFWNPNHLLFDPVGSWWQKALADLGVTRSGPDRLKLLSIATGAVAVALFRWGVAGPIAPGRVEANHATAWIAFGAAFAGLWISDETHMVQMPFVALAAIALVAYVQRPSWGSTLGMGAAAALAGLFYISNLLLAAALGIVLGVWHASRGEWRQGMRAFGGIAAGSLLVAGFGFLAAWALVARPEVGFVEWVTAYGGGQISERVASSYGVRWTLSGLAIGIARALYGASNAVVDIAPVIEFVRDGRGSVLGVILSLAALAAAAVLIGVGIARAVRGRRDRRETTALLLVCAWVAAYMMFAIYWNNSDNQFYFQLAVPLGAVIALLPFTRSRGTLTLFALSAFALAWNVRDAAANDVLYPRFERVALLQHALSDAHLVIYPGDDEINQLFYFAKRPEKAQRLAITTLARTQDPVDGLRKLELEVSRTLAAGGRVDVLSVYDVPARSNPWKALGQQGYGAEEVTTILNRFPVDRQSRMVGPFTLRSIRPQSIGQRGGVSGAGN